MSGVLHAVNTSAASPSAAAPATFACEVCGQQSQRLFQIQGYWIRRCDHCGHRFTEIAVENQHVQSQHIEQVYSDDYFAGGGAGYRDYLSEQPVFLRRGRWYARLLSRYMPHGSVLDVGTAAGFFLSALAADGWTVHGLEPNASMAAYATSQLGLPVENASLETCRDDNTFDLVTMLQVIAHFAHPRVGVEKAARLLKPRGFLLVETWNRNSLTARAFGRSWHEYNPPSVLHMFSKSALINMICDSGFEHIASGRPRRSITAGYAKSVTQHWASKSLAHRALSTLFHLFPDQTPIPYPGNDLFWSLFRRIN